MTLSTVAISIAATYFTGAAMANGHAHFELTGNDTDGTLIVPQGWDATLDATGTGVVNLWPNSRGTNGTQYGVTLYDYAGALQYSGVCTVPTVPCALHTILSIAPPASVSDAQTASSAAQAYAQEAASSAATGLAAQQASVDASDAAAASALAASNSEQGAAESAIEAAASAASISATTLLISWALAQAFRLTTGTRDGNGALTSGSIVWPDGSTGTFTADTVSSAFPGAVDAWHATYINGNGTKTVTQIAVTRDSNGAVTAQPAITIT